MNKVILAYHNSGEDILSELYVKKGYHNLGRFFNSQENFLIEGDRPSLGKMNPDDIALSALKRTKRSIHSNNYTFSKVNEYRYGKLLQYFSTTTGSNILTMDFPTLSQNPELYSLLHENDVTCLATANKFDQLLLRCHQLSSVFFDKKTFVIETSFFSKEFHDLMNLERLQNYFISTRSAQLMYRESLAGNPSDNTIIDKIKSEVLNTHELNDFYFELVRVYNLNWN